MKPSVVLLIGSLVANAALLAGWLAMDRPGAHAGDSAPNKAPAAVNPADATPPNHWTRIETSDLDAFAAKLPALGLSPAEMRTMLQWKIGQAYPRAGGPADRPYWQSQMSSYLDPKLNAERMARSIELLEAHRKYLSRPEFMDSTEDNPDMFAYAERNWGPNLSAEKIRALGRIQEDYQLIQMKQSLERARAGVVDHEADAAAYALLMKERETDIARLLTPEEYAEYELRSSPTAQSLRGRLAAFQPTEEEYRTLFALHKPFEVKRHDSRLSSAEHMAMVEQLKAQVTAALGPERALDFVESQTAHDQTARLVARLGLPPRTNAEIRALREELTQRATVVRDDAQLPASERTAKLKALADEARTTIAKKLGPEGFEAYYDLKHEWIRAIETGGGG